MGINTSGFSINEMQVAEIERIVNAILQDRGSIILGQSAVPSAALTGTLVETTLATVKVPGGMMGKNGRIRTTALFSYSNSANNKTMRFKHAGNIFVANVTTTSLTMRTCGDVANRNAMNSQILGAGAGLTGYYGASTAAIATSAVDTTIDQDITITGLLANVADSIILEAYLVELFPAP